MQKGQITFNSQQLRGNNAFHISAKDVNFNFLENTTIRIDVYQDGTHIFSSLACLCVSLYQKLTFLFEIPYSFSHFNQITVRISGIPDDLGIKVAPVYRAYYTQYAA
jgi:hypothetical protein